MTTPDVTAAPPWREPWRTGGPLALVRRPQIVWLLAQGELRNKYRGTWLGGAWEYVRPLTRFFVYFVVIGILLEISKRVDNYGVYVFSGVVTVQFFASALVSGTRSLAKHGSLLRRVNVPREALPIATVLAALIRQRPAVIILALAAVATGWRPNHLAAVPQLVAGVIMLMVFVSGLALITSVANMYIKDTQHAVDTLVTLTRYGSPVIYPWTLVSDKYGVDSLITTIYLSNPVTVAMYGIRAFFWEPTVSAEAAAELPPIPPLPLALSVVISLGTLAFGLWLVRRTEHRVASRISWSS